MIKSRLTLTAGLIVLGATAAQAVWYTNEATFVANLQGPFYLEDFNNFTFGNPLNGSQTSWSAPGANGYGWDASAALGLWSNQSALSTNTANDPLTITFTGAPVTAFGGNFGNSDINGNFIPGTITLTLSNNETQSINTTTEAFLGWTGNVAIASVTMVASGATNNWINVDHVYTGSAVPEPATMAVLGLGAAALLRRRRK